MLVPKIFHEIIKQSKCYVFIKNSIGSSRKNTCKDMLAHVCLHKNHSTKQVILIHQTYNKKAYKKPNVFDSPDTYNLDTPMKNVCKDV